MGGDDILIQPWNGPGGSGHHSPALDHGRLHTYLGGSLGQSIEERMQEQVEFVTPGHQGVVSYSLGKRRVGSLGGALRSVFHAGRVYGASVYNSWGRGVFASRQPSGP